MRNHQAYYGYQVAAGSCCCEWVAICMNRGPDRMIYNVGTESLRLRGTRNAKLCPNEKLPKTFWLQPINL
jgi:hypothetical protein